MKQKDSKVLLHIYMVKIMQPVPILKYNLNSWNAS